MTIETCETVVGTRLVTWLKQQNGVVIVSFHPTSAKAYQSELIRIPKLDDNGMRTKQRYHIDIIALAGSTLWLIELKCRLSESGIDIQKLKEIKKDYSPEQLHKLIVSRLTTVDLNEIAEINNIELSLGVEYLDAELPMDFTVYEVTEETVNVHKQLNKNSS